MDKSAVLQIQESVTQQAAAKHLTDALNTDSAVVVLPEDFRLSDIESFMPTRRRFKGVFSTNSIGNFALYLNENGVFDNGAVFINAEKMKADAIFDMGDKSTPLHGNHHASLQLKPTALFDRILSLDGQPVSQRPMAEKLEDMSHSATFIADDAETRAAAAVIQAVRNVNIETMRNRGSSEGNFVSEKSDLERITVTDSDNLPAYVNFKTVTYAGLKERVIPCRFSVLTSGNELRFKLDIINREEMLEEIADEFMEVVSKEIGGDKDKQKIFIGSMTM